MLHKDATKTTIKTVLIVTVARRNQKQTRDFIQKICQKPEKSDQTQPSTRQRIVVQKWVVIIR